MRPLKFRAWDKIQQQMWEVYELILSETPGVRATIHPWGEALLAFKLRDDECEIQQWTGFCDRNGKEIYEGDIFCHDDGNTCVIWESAGFDARFEDGMNCLPLWEITNGNSGVNEVMGNIYENPEMWKAE